MVMHLVVTYYKVMAPTAVAVGDRAVRFEEPVPPGRNPVQAGRVNRHVARLALGHVGQQDIEGQHGVPQVPKVYCPPVSSHHVSCKYTAPTSKPSSGVPKNSPVSKTAGLYFSLL